MRALILCAVFSIASAKPGGLYSGGWDAPSLSSVSLVHQPEVQIAQPVVQQVVAQPVVHQVVAQPVVSQQYVHAPVAIAKPAATSYSSFQRVIHPSVVHAAPVYSQPIVHAPVVSQPIIKSYAQPIVQAVHQPIVQAYHQPIVKSYSEPIYSSVGVGHGW